MLKTYSSSGLKNIQSSGREIFPTTKDKLDAALNAAPTVVLEKEVHNRIVEDNYLLSGSRDVTQDNDESDDELVVEVDTNTVRLEMFFELWFEKEWLICCQHSYL